jgi:uncharacterized membrane protein YeiB
MQNEQLKRWVGAHAAIGFLLFPGLCALPLLSFITPEPARWVFAVVWLLLVCAFGGIVLRVVLRLRHEARLAATQTEELDNTGNAQ